MQDPVRGSKLCTLARLVEREGRLGASTVYASESGHRLFGRVHRINLRLLGILRTALIVALVRHGELNVKMSSGSLDTEGSCCFGCWW